MDKRERFFLIVILSFCLLLGVLEALYYVVRYA
jgi:hypothetical protein